MSLSVCLKKKKKKYPAILFWGKHILPRQKNGKSKRTKKKKKAVSVLRGIHHRDGGGMPGINLSHAFSVLLTFSSSSPKRRVVCQRAFIKADRRGKQCGGKREGEVGGRGETEDSGSPRGRVDRLSQGRCLSLRKVAPFPPQPGMKRREGCTQGTSGQMWRRLVAELPAPQPAC